MICVGDCGVDRYSLPNSRSGNKFILQDLCGGISFNFAHHARKHLSDAWDVDLVTALGNDAEADWISAKLNQQNFDSHITYLTGKTPVQEIRIEPDGEKNFTAYHEGVLAVFQIDGQRQNMIQNSDALIMVHYQQIESLFRSTISVSSRGLRCVDFADYSEHPNPLFIENYINQIDIAFFGLGAMQTDLIAELEALAGRYHKLFVITLGAKGCMAFDGNKAYKRAAEPVSKVVDTTGAGDCFAAGFVSAYLQGETVEVALNQAAIDAAQVVAQMGATS